MKRAPISRMSDKKRAEQKDERKAKAIARVRVNALNFGHCEVCSGAPAAEFAHRLAAGRQGKWRASNGLYLCHSCHAAQRDHKGGEGLATALGQVLPSMRNGERPDPEQVPVQCVYGRVYLTDLGDVIPVGADDPEIVEVI